MTFETVEISATDVDSDDISIAVDTALSWDGTFPEIGAGDYTVEIATVEGDDATILVSRRYTSAIDADNAAEIALNAYAERNDLETDDEGMPSPDECRVVRVARVV